jgi:hypothetical protein
VRRFSSTDKPDVTDEELKKQLIPLYWLRPFRALPTDAGMHRWVWDLHYPAPDSTRHEYPIAAVPGDTPRHPLGPAALPGSYTARLTANGKSYTAAFTLKMDPRIKIAAASLDKKFQAEMHLATLLTQTSKAVMQAGSIREPLQKLTQQASGATLDSIKNFQNRLTEVFGTQTGFSAPATDTATLVRISGQIAVLYGQVWQAEAEPTSSQSAAISAIERDASNVMKRWNALKTAELPALNRELHGANLPEVQVESDPHKEDAAMDEE